MTKDRLEEILRLVRHPSPRGFRAECRELVTECIILAEQVAIMREFNAVGEPLPSAVAAACDRAGRANNSALLVAAADVINQLIREKAIAEDAARDAMDLASSPV